MVIKESPKTRHGLQLISVFLSMLSQKEIRYNNIKNKCQDRGGKQNTIHQNEQFSKWSYWVEKM